MYNPSIDNLDVPCPECHRIMVQLADYAATDDIGPGLDNSDLYRYPGGAGGLFFDFALVDWMVESVSSMVRRARLRGICRRELSAFPGSLICPACLHLLRRR